MAELGEGLVSIPPKTTATTFTVEWKSGEEETL